MNVKCIQTNSIILRRLCQSRPGFPLKLLKRHYAITGNEKADKALDNLTGGKAEQILRSYEDFVGLTEVRNAQDKVIEAEKEFLSLQGRRHEAQVNMTDIQNRLKQIRLELMQVHRGDDRFIPLVTEEDGIIKEENQLKTMLTSFEKEERNKFAKLSAAVRESHEKERARTERTKYWSVMGSLVGVVLGVIGTTINNYRRMKELRGLVKDSTSDGTKVQNLVTGLTETIHKQHETVTEFLSELRDSNIDTNLKQEVGKSSISKVDSNKDLKVLIAQSNQILEFVKRQETVLCEEIEHIKHLLGPEMAKNTHDNVVYVGPEIKEMLADTEQNMERKMKTNTLWNVTLIYTGFAISLPIIYSIFKSGS